MNFDVQKVETNTLPAGRYVISDPCYIFDEKYWDDLLRLTDYLDDVVFSVNGHLCFSHTTAYGDGSYFFEKKSLNVSIIDDKSVDGLGVDSGVLAIIPISLIEEMNFELDIDYLIVEYKSDFKVSYDDGIYNLGGIIIDSKSIEDDEDWDEDWDDD